MPELVLSAPVTKSLQALQEVLQREGGSKAGSSADRSSDRSAAADELVEKLRLDLAPKMDAASPAVPSDAAAATTAEARVPHSLLVEVATWARGSRIDMADLEPTKYTLNTLLRDARVYIAPKPVRVRSPELEASLAKIRLAQEEAEYEAMLAAPRGAYSSGPFRLTSRGQDAASHYQNATYTPGTGRGMVPRPAPLTAAQEAEEWKQVRSHLSAAANVMLSVGAVATAAWWAGGNADVAWKTLTALFLGLLVGGAEVVLYARHFDNVAKKKALDKAARNK